jgi:hypothetical protein
MMAMKGVPARIMRGVVRAAFPTALVRAPSTMDAMPQTSGERASRLSPHTCRCFLLHAYYTVTRSNPPTFEDILLPTASSMASFEYDIVS